MRIDLEDVIASLRNTYILQTFEQTNALTRILIGCCPAETQPYLRNYLYKRIVGYEIPHNVASSFAHRDSSIPQLARLLICPEENLRRAVDTFVRLRIYGTPGYALKTEVERNAYLEKVLKEEMTEQINRTNRLRELQNNSAKSE